jgi:hypothetical protein
MINVGTKLASKISNVDMMNLYIMYRENFISSKNTYSNTKYFQTFNCIVTNIKDRDLSTLSWNILHEAAIDKNSNHISKVITIRCLMDFLLFAVENNCYLDEDKYQYIENKEHLLLFINNNGQKLHTYFLNPNSCPNSIMVFQRKRDKSILYFPTIHSKNQFLLKLFRNFMYETNAYENTRYVNNSTMFSHFEEAIFPNTIEDFTDFSDEIFFKCIRNFETRFENRRGETSRVTVFFQWLLTQVPEDIKNKNFKLVNTVLLGYYHITKNISKGYIVVEYSPYETPKYYDKMLLLPNSDDFHNKGESCRVYPFNISEIKNHVLKKWYTDYFWKGVDYRLDERVNRLSTLKKLFIYLDTNVSSEEHNIDFSEKEIARYMMLSGSKNISESTKATRFCELKKFMTFIELEYGFKIKPFYYKMLSSSYGRRNPNKDAYLSEEITQIIKYISDVNEVLTMALMIHSRSEIRITSIMKLKIDCIQEVLSSGGKPEYAVQVHTKRSGSEYELINISHYVKTYIDEAIKLTHDVRKKADSYDKDYIFLHTLKSRHSPRQFGENAIRNIVFEACKKLKIDFKGTTGIRNYFMQYNSQYVSDNNINPSILRSLTGHSNETHVRDYDKVNMIEFCRVHYKVSIGKINLRGNVTKSSTLSHEAQVGNRCGFCAKKHCNFDGNLDCFMCNNFVTTLSCIPFFEIEIEKLDKKIKEETVVHEIDFLLSKKKLLVAYLSELMILRGDKISYEQIC